MFERDYFVHLGTNHKLFPLGRRFRGGDVPVRLKHEEKQMKSYLDETGVRYKEQRHVNIRGIPGAGTCFFHDFWIEEEDRIFRVTRRSYRRTRYA